MVRGLEATALVMVRGPERTVEGALNSGCAMLAAAQPAAGRRFGTLRDG